MSASRQKSIEKASKGIVKKMVVVKKKLVKYVDEKGIEMVTEDIEQVLKQRQSQGLVKVTAEEIKKA